MRKEKCMNNFSISAEQQKITVATGLGVNITIHPSKVEVICDRKVVMTLQSSDVTDYCIRTARGLMICLVGKRVNISDKIGNLLAEISLEKREVTLLSRQGKTTIGWKDDGEKIALQLPIRDEGISEKKVEKPKEGKKKKEE